MILLYLIIAIGILVMVALFFPIRMYLQIENSQFKFALSYLFFKKETLTDEKKEVLRIKTEIDKQKKKVKKPKKPAKKKRKKISLFTVINHWDDFKSIFLFGLRRIKALLKIPQTKIVDWEWIIAGDNPAQIGFLFGLYQSVKHFLPSGKVTMNFLEEKSYFHCNIVMTIYLWKFVIWGLQTIAIFPYRNAWNCYKIIRMSHP
ncbi:MAG: hypothetical protein N2450_08895 [bacterium]|nr:hypothetical protein [bacterium]